MKILGIIAEYNPFHAGHAYQIEKAKELSGADYVVVVMSGHFVQRGEPAIYDPYIRASFALNNGVDAVFMMPAWASVSSAEGFAGCGVEILDALGCDCISYGIEHQDEKEQLKPNNILAGEYKKAFKAINSSMDIIEIERIGNGYSDDSLKGRYPSATAIRKAILDGRLKPETAENLKPVSPDDFLPDIQAVVTRLVHEGYDLTQYTDVCTEIADRIRKNSFKEDTYENLVLSVKTRRYAYTRIARCFMHILLDITDEDCSVYANLIGFRKEAGELLSELKKRSEIGIISKPADYKEILEKDAFAARLYNQVYFRKYHETRPDFYRRGIIIV